MEDFLISVEHLAKCYRVYSQKMDRIKEALDPFRHKRHKTFYALKDISFNVKQGESIGIVGINGSGKSTLLKTLCGVITPTRGTLSVRGKISALLELGAGFHPERTGMENLFFQGSIQGFSHQEMEKMVPDIVDFADIGDFIHQPVKVYSSGMFVRLAFAAAVQVKPDILIVDEALSVGDIRFQRKCFARIEEMKKEGVTFLFVSHASEQIITHCERAILLSHGSILLDGDPREVVNHYLDILFGRTEHEKFQKKLPCADDELLENTPPLYRDAAASNIFDVNLRHFLCNKSIEDSFSSNPLYNKYEYRWGDGNARILDAYLASSGDPKSITTGDELKLYIKACFLNDYYRPIWGCTIKTHEGVTVYGTNSEINGAAPPYDEVRAGDVVYISIAFRCSLAPGNYFISLGLAADAGNTPLDRRYDSLLLAVSGPANFFGLGDLNMAINNTEIDQ